MKTAKYFYAKSLDELKAAAEKIGFPCVVKPLMSSSGKGQSLVKSADELEHAWEYGYVIRYPKDKSAITGIISEPWHLRYVGIPAAQLMTEQDLCLEEFLGVAYDDQRDGISYGAGWINTGR